MITWPNFVSQLFNGLATGALLALISSGLTIIYGTLGVLNLAHGAMFMLGGYAGYVAFQATGSFVVAVIAGALFLVVVGAAARAGRHPPFLRPPAGGPDPASPSASASCSSSWCGFGFGSLSLTVPPPAWAAGVTPMGFMIYPTYRIVVLGIAAVALGGALHRALPHAARHDRARGHRGFRHGRHARHQRLPRVHGGVRHRRDGRRLRRHRQRAGGVADARHGRGDPGADLRRRRHRRRRLVSRRDPRRPDRRRDPQPDLDGQSGLFAGDAVRGDDARAAAAAAGPARRSGAANERGGADAAPPAPAGRGADRARPRSRRRSCCRYLGFAPDTVNQILVWGLFGIGFDILFGYTGLLSFGQSAFYGTGGFVAAYLLDQQPDVERDRSRCSSARSAPALVGVAGRADRAAAHRHLLRDDHGRDRRDVLLRRELAALRLDRRRERPARRADAELRARRLRPIRSAPAGRCTASWPSATSSAS